MAQPITAPTGTGHPRRWTILGVLVVSLLVVVLDNTVLNVAMTTIADPKKGLGATQSQLEWSINSYTLVFAGLLFTWGVLADRFGRRRVLLIGMVLFGLSSLASAYAQSPGQLIGARALMAIGGAAVLPATLSVISNVFDPRERGRAIGVWAGAVGLAVAIGPVVGGLLLEHFWWGSVFLINVPIVIAGVVAIMLLVPESRDPKPGRIDYLGVLLSIAGLVALVYGIIEGGDSGDWGRWDVWGGIAAGVLILGAFVAYERSIDHPSLDVRLFRDPRFSAAVSAVGLVFFAAMGSFFFGAFYLQTVRGYTPLQAGALMVPFAVAQLVFAPRSAAFVKRFGPKAVCAAGLAMVAVTFLGFVYLKVDTPIWVVEVLFFVQGVGMANVMPPATESVMASLPRERAGVGSAVNNTIRQVGGALGVAVLGSVLSSVYRGDMKPTLAGLPAQVPDAARQAASESVAGAHGAAERLGAAGQGTPLGTVAHGLADSANAAFVHAMHWAAAGSTAVAVIGVLVVLAFLPGRPKAGDTPPAAEGQAPEPALAEA